MRSNLPSGRCFLYLVAFVLLGFSVFGIELRHAKNFKIDEVGEGYEITVLNAYKGAGSRVFTYKLVRESNSPKAQGSLVVKIPVKRVIGLSTTFFSSIDLLGEVDSLVGVGAFKYVNTPSLLEKIKKGELVEVGSESAKNVEIMVSLDPDLVFTNAMGNPDHDVHPVLGQMGIPSALTAAYMEETLLGRAEWIKFVAAFYDKIELAQAIFDETEVRYLKLAELTKDVQPRPTVFTNAPWGNVWYVPSGNSYVANVIRDAGATYLWKDVISQGSMPFDFEAVYEKAVDADFWVNMTYLDSLGKVMSGDIRYQDFKALKNGNLFSETKLLNAAGGNDFWERGFAHPDEILADMIRIFHPELLPDHQLIYYRDLGNDSFINQ